MKFPNKTKYFFRSSERVSVYNVCICSDQKHVNIVCVKEGDL